jgi:gliding motility-associated-like protein
MRLTLLLLLILLGQLTTAQNSTFDFSNEGWTADGDAFNNAAVWQSTGGTPGGYILGTDGSIGGTWYFVAPDNFEGIKCDAYGRFLRYDQFVSSNAAPNNSPDVEIKGGGLTLVFNNPVLPGTTWTHFDLLLREDAGWRLNTLTGLTPTAAQFKQVLANITSLRIRGEYLSSADDSGGLDNVVLESNLTFVFDLDGDDSSGAIGGNFQTEPTCIPSNSIVDTDVLLSTEARIDSIVIKIVGGTALEFLELDVLVANIDVVRYSSGMIALVSDGTATIADFLLLLQEIQYLDTTFDPKSGVRVINIEVFTDCSGVGEAHRSFLPIFLQPDAGTPGDTVLCYGSGLLDLRTVLEGQPDDNGAWFPPLQSGTNFFNPDVDTAGTYTYIVPPAPPCDGDTNFVQVRIDYPFVLRPDTTVCYDKTLFIAVPPGLRDWVWSDGSQKVQLPVDTPGVYTLEGYTDYCTFRDSVTVNFFTCVECPPYPPNVFSPNDDGLNDDWHIFLYCRWSKYRLEVYDRWGSMVFAADDPETTWDGWVRGKEAEAGVYVWRMQWTGELFGQPRVWDFKGDVTIVR